MSLPPLIPHHLRSDTLFGWVWMSPPPPDPHHLRSDTLFGWVWMSLRS